MPMGGIILCSGGDAAIDRALHDVFNRHDPLENKFPIGCKVTTTLSESAVALKLMSEDHYKKADALGYARLIKGGPMEVIGIERLTDEDGSSLPYISVMVDDGYMFLFKEKELARI